MRYCIARNQYRLNVYEKGGLRRILIWSKSSLPFHTATTFIFHNQRVREKNLIFSLSLAVELWFKRFPPRDTAITCIFSSTSPLTAEVIFKLIYFHGKQLFHASNHHRQEEVRVDICLCMRRCLMQYSVSVLNNKQPRHRIT